MDYSDTNGNRTYNDNSEKRTYTNYSVSEKDNVDIESVFHHDEGISDTVKNHNLETAFMNNDDIDKKISKIILNNMNDNGYSQNDLKNGHTVDYDATKSSSSNTKIKQKGILSENFSNKNIDDNFKNGYNDNADNIVDNNGNNNNKKNHDIYVNKRSNLPIYYTNNSIPITTT
eukprot:CAMPEP_0119046184 /NCGR_PEP_ID=MMETSP1177-20130426/44939_1 /TAXON_ID=2985 /ORGANISM="Ochromonas sp, Strain CCMP1899" /LENGTH=172 /DNA_ID=CAMNT_0007018975 /DNA_START=886 /DNA_END=1400 /DNA_ORIENTATION=-